MKSWKLLCDTTATWCSLWFVVSAQKLSVEQRRFHMKCRNFCLRKRLGKRHRFTEVTEIPIFSPSINYLKEFVYHLSGSVFAHCCLLLKACMYEERDACLCLCHVNGGYQMTLGEIQEITCKSQINLLAQIEKVQVNNISSFWVSLKLKKRKIAWI